VAYLIDTSVLARLANAADEQHAVAVRAVIELHRSGEVLHSTPQVFVEFRSVATRPREANGLGLSVTEAEAQSAGFEAAFPLLPESPEIYLAWKAIVHDLGIISKQVHDARLIAVCQVNDVDHILTFNGPHFTRMAGQQPSMVVVHPSNV
jgi:predicted nucleic acid-binding protein